MSTFALAVDLVLRLVLRWEGGDSHRLDDPGGLTRFGIAQATHPTLDVESLTREEAVAIYRRDYWDALRLDDLPPAVALYLFDSAVNLGPVRAVRMLQAGVGLTGRAIDGVLGPVTRSAVWGTDLAALLRELAARRVYAYGQLSGFAVFGLGWARRLVDVYDRARALL